MMDRAKLLQAVKPQVRKLNVSLPGCDDLYVRGMTAAEHDTFTLEQMELRKSGGQAAALDLYSAGIAVRCLCDSDGNRILADSDAAALAAGSTAIVGPASDMGLLLSGMLEGMTEKKPASAKTRKPGSGTKSRAS